MSHWFDSACKSLTPTSDPASITRRGALLGMLGGVFAATSDSAWGQSSSGHARASTGLMQPQAAKNGSQIVMKPGACVQTEIGPNYMRHIHLQQGDLTYEKSLSYSGSDSSIVDSVVIRRNGEIVIDSKTHTQKGGATSAKFSYGVAYGKAGSASLLTNDGKRYTGVVNGEQVAGRVGFKSSGHNLISAGGKIVSGGVLAPEIRGPLAALLQSAHSSPTNCQTTHPVTGGGRIVPQTKPAKPMHLPAGAKVFSPADSDLGDDWYNPGETYQSPDCDNCWTNCESTAEDAAGTSDWKSWIDPVDFVTTIAVYDATLLACWLTCRLPGGGCCPVPCGGPFICCGKGDNCFRGNTCCPGAQKVCNDECCAPDVTQCAANGTCGCRGGSYACQDFCCDNGTDCCDEQCCPAGGCHNGICCPSPKSLCGTNCCAPFTTCCNGQCCGGKCVNGTCCPSSQVCGNSCCAPGTACNNGRCTGCAAGQKAVQWFKYDGSFGGVACCPLSSPNCCNGVCCASNQNFCGYATGVPVCSTASPIH